MILIESFEGTKSQQTSSQEKHKNIIDPVERAGRP
jgi:hypothetical protein